MTSTYAPTKANAKMNYTKPVTKNKPLKKRTSSQPDAPLNLFSTSQTTSTAPAKCHKNAPYICIPSERGSAKLYQSCCNDWTCPRCGNLRAKREYGRMVEGARELAKSHQLYMMTITCQGQETVETAEEKYLERTNRLNTNIRAYAQRKQGKKVEYAAVIERQERGHPHTHYLTTFCPNDAYYIVDDYTRYCDDIKLLNTQIPLEMRFTPLPVENFDHRQMFSMWLSLACVNAGLGVQVRIAICDEIEGASRYIAKYLFKSAMTTKFPDGWRRVRYSRGWPKLPEIEASSAFVVMSAWDWLQVAQLNKPVECFGKTVYQRAYNWRVYQAYWINEQGRAVQNE